MKEFDNQKDGLVSSADEEAGLMASLERGSGEDAELAQALRDFKSSVHAWSDAAYHRPRAVAQEVKRRSWRLALGWAMGCLLAAGTVSGGLMEREHRLDAARNAARQRAAEQAIQVRQQQAAKLDEEDLMAQIDSDVSRQVPSALEPLAQMMDEDETK